MRINIYINDASYTIDVPPEMIEEGGDFFTKMDHDMDQGWQMSRQFVENPDGVQRCQIAADKILTAMHTGNKKLALLMAAYILRRFPGVQGLQIDTHGEMSNTKLIKAPETLVPEDD
ncbi:MAG: hypothetical protein OES46_16795 [Gammaproteobacteria bacterium]|nr:hypothetical protein [Gammaproteobacteria bacterium]